MRKLPLFLTAGAAFALASTPAEPQDLGAVESLFSEVSAFTVFYQVGGVFGSGSVGGGLLQGAGTEVLIELGELGDATLELGLGASFLRGYESEEGSALDLRTSVRSLPSITLYGSWSLARWVDGYAGATFGLVELWNAQAYDATGAPWDLEARTYEAGLSGGFFFPGKALFVEAGVRQRDFASVKWTVPDGETVPDEWRSLDLSGWYVQGGVQLRLPEDDDPNDDITPPAPAGVWTLERMNGAVLPGTMSGSRQLVHAVLRLQPDTLPDATEGTGTWRLERFVRTGDRVVAETPDEGSYTTGETLATRESVLTLKNRADQPVGTVERLAGRLYLNWDNHVLVFAPGNAPQPSK